TMTMVTGSRPSEPPQQPPVVAGAEEQEAARAGHRLEPGPDRRRVAALGERLVDVRLEPRSEEHTSERQSLAYLVCRPLLEKKNPPQRHQRTGDVPGGTRDGLEAAVD